MSLPDLPDRLYWYVESMQAGWVRIRLGERYPRSGGHYRWVAEDEVDVSSIYSEDHFIHEVENRAEKLRSVAFRNELIPEWIKKNWGA